MIISKINKTIYLGHDFESRIFSRIIYIMIYFHISISITSYIIIDIIFDYLIFFPFKSFSDEIY